MTVNYIIDVDRATAVLPAQPQLSLYGEQKLQELVDKLEELTGDIRITAEDLIRIISIHSILCTQIAEQALEYVRQDGDLPKFGG